MLRGMRLLRLHLTRLYHSLWAHILVQGSSVPLGRRRWQGVFRKHAGGRLASWSSQSQPRVCCQVAADVLRYNTLP